MRQAWVVNVRGIGRIVTFVVGVVVLAGSCSSNTTQERATPAAEPIPTVLDAVTPTAVHLEPTPSAQPAAQATPTVPAATPPAATAAPTVAASSPEPTVGETELVAEGAAIFELQCSMCHGLRGQGSDRGPTLRSRQLDARVDLVVLVRSGRGLMPAFATQLTAGEIEAVISFVLDELAG